MTSRSFCLVALSALAIAVTAAAPASAQSRADSERRLASIRSQIGGVEQQVQRARGEEASAVEAFDALGTEIALREQLLIGYRQSEGEIRNETATLQTSIVRLQSEVQLARTTYRDRARHAYIHGRRNALALILSAGSVNQMVVRARYLQQFARRRRSQVERIAQQTEELQLREGAVRETLEATQRLLAQSQAERQTLGLRRRERAALVETVRGRRSDLERQLAQRRSDARDLEGLVQGLVAQDRRRADAERTRVAAARQATERAEAQRQADVAARAGASARADAARQADLQRQADAAARRAAQRRDLRLRPTPRRESDAPAPFPTPVPPGPPVAAATPGSTTPGRTTTRRTAPVPRPVAPPTPRSEPAPRRATPVFPTPVPDAPPVASNRPTPRRPRTEPAPESRPAPAPAPRPAPRTETPEPAADVAVSLSGPFRQNRGRLPWPADGTVTGAFGPRRDADYGTTISSIGIDLSTRPGAPSRAVFEGTVERVGTMATYGTFVMVSHGDFTTIYGNLSEVVVARGQTVSAGQVVGRAGTATDRRGSQLFFALFESGRPTNPIPWLRGH